MIYEFDTVTKVFTLKSSTTWQELVETVNKATKGCDPQHLTIRAEPGASVWPWQPIDPYPIWVNTPRVEYSNGANSTDIVSEDGTPGVRVKYSASADVVVGKDESGKYVGGIDPTHNAADGLSMNSQAEYIEDKYCTDFSITKEKTIDISRYEGAMSFSMALEAMKDGKKVYRREWNWADEGNIALSLEADDSYPVEQQWAYKPVFYFYSGGSREKRTNAFTIEDILGNDWFLVKHR